MAIIRQFRELSKNSTFSDLASMSRDDLVRRYAALSTAQSDLREARGDLVCMYREKPQCWPDGIDTVLDRWYRPDEWTDDGTFIAPTVIVTAPLIVTPEPAQVALIVTFSCEQCGKEMPRSNAKAGKQRFCSGACKVKASRQRKAKP